MADLLRVGDSVVNVAAVASAHWDLHKNTRTLFVYYVGGRYTQHTGADAQKLWERINSHAGQLIG